MPSESPMSATDSTMHHREHEHEHQHQHYQSNSLVILLKNPSIPIDPYAKLFQSQLDHAYTPQFVPLLTHTHRDKSLTKKFLTSPHFLNEVGYFIITSQRAVEMFQECIDEINDEDAVKKILGKVGYTVGPATFKILQKQGFNNVRGGESAGNGMKLAELILSEVDNGEKIVFFTGEIRKDIIPKRLAGENGGGFRQFEEFVIYKTMERNDIIKRFENLISVESGHGEKELGWIVFFSPQGTKDIVQYLKKNDNGGGGFKLACIGPTTEEYLVENGLAPDVIAAKPDPTSLVAGIVEFDKRREKEKKLYQEKNS